MCECAIVEDVHLKKKVGKLSKYISTYVKRLWYSTGQMLEPQTQRHYLVLRGLVDIISSHKGLCVFSRKGADIIQCKKCISIKSPLELSFIRCADRLRATPTWTIASATPQLSYLFYFIFQFILFHFSCLHFSSEKCYFMYLFRKSIQQRILWQMEFSNTYEAF